MIVGSRRKQRGALRTHDSAGETPPARACAAQPPSPDKTQGRGGWVTENCGRQRLSVSLADGERNTKGRPDVHPLG